MYVYLLRERERERERNNPTTMILCTVSFIVRCRCSLSRGEPKRRTLLPAGPRHRRPLLLSLLYYIILCYIILYDIMCVYIYIYMYIICVLFFFCLTRRVFHSRTSCGCSGGEGTPPETLKCLMRNPYG